mmetsp:Transcript_49778/g.83390  ORF Transcript_49778/g.83390 Transcript_49778/m.83390 type:complete len:246 (-) Transcript_49778:1267-2004(-)
MGTTGLLGPPESLTPSTGLPGGGPVMLDRSGGCSDSVICFVRRGFFGAPSVLMTAGSSLGRLAGLSFASGELFVLSGDVPVFRGDVPCARGEPPFVSGDPASLLMGRFFRGDVRFGDSASASGAARSLAAPFSRAWGPSSPGAPSGDGDRKPKGPSWGGPFGLRLAGAFFFTGAFASVLGSSSNWNSSVAGTSGKFPLAACTRSLIRVASTTGAFENALRLPSGASGIASNSRFSSVTMALTQSP